MCADPVTLLVAGSTLFSAATSVQQGMSAASVARYNAKVERNTAYSQELLQRDQSRRDIASQTIALGAQGSRVDTGTPLLLVGESARNAELDALQIRKTGLQRGAVYDAQASNATTGAIFGAGAELLSGAVKLQQLGKIFPANSNAPGKTGTGP